MAAEPTGWYSDPTHQDLATFPPTSRAVAPQGTESTAQDRQHQLLMPPTELPQRCVRDACGLLGAERGLVYLFDGDAGVLQLASALGFSPNASPSATLPLNAGVLGWVAVHLEAARIDELRTDERCQPPFDPQLSGSLAAVPIVQEKTMYGVLAVWNTHPNAFKPPHLAVLRVIAELLATSLANARQAREAQIQRQQLMLLITAARSLTRSLEPTEVFTNIALGIGHLINYEDVLIYAYEPATEELRVVTSQGSAGDRLRNERVSIHNTASLAAAVARNRRARCHAPDTSSLQPGRLTEAFLAGKDQALLCVPLISKEHLRGILTLTRAQAFEDLDVRMMEDLAPLVATALENHSLHAAVKAEQERLAAIFATTTDGIAVIVNGGRIVDANGAFARMAGRTIDQVRGERFQGIFTPLNAPADATRTDIMALVQALEDALRGRTVAPMLECTMPGPANGAPRQILLSISPNKSPEGYQAVVVARDVTEFRAMDRQKTQLLHMLSHEIRAPLVPLTGYLEMALRGMAGPLNDRQVELIRHARAASRHLAGRVKDFSTILSPEDVAFFPSDLEIVDIQRVIQSALEEVELLAQEREIPVHITIPPRLPQIPGNTERLVQVVRNLLSNAIKFTPRGGRVWVEARAQASMLEVSVADTGCGIAPEHLPYLFEPYYQATGEASAMRPSGQGLGLAIVKQIVSRHGGQVQVVSTPGNGSRFTFVLPLRAPLAL